MKGLVVLPAVTRACFFPSDSCNLLDNLRGDAQCLCVLIYGAPPVCLFC